MNQSITPDLAAVMVAVRLTGLLSSLCTISVPPDAFNEAGALDPSVPYVPLSGHVNLPCTAPPLQTGDRTGPTEKKSESEILSLSAKHVLLDGYYPEILSHYRATIDGTIFDVMNAESDSQHQMTRLAVQLVTV